MGRLVDPQAREVAVLTRLATFDERDLLELGCGDGRTGRRLAGRAHSVLGVDPDAEAVAEAEAAARADGFAECHYRAIDTLELELPSASVDVALFPRSL